MVTIPVSLNWGSGFDSLCGHNKTVYNDMIFLFHTHTHIPTQALTKTHTYIHTHTHTHIPTHTLTETHTYTHTHTHTFKHTHTPLSTPGSGVRLWRESVPAPWSVCTVEALCAVHKK